MRAEPDDLLVQYAEAVADGEMPAASGAGDVPLAPAISDLRIIAEIARVHRERLGVGSGETTDGPAPPLLQGSERMWGHLRILEPLGSGTFGEVFRAWDTNLDREVALKLLRGGQVSLESALREGQRLARVSHPNVVAVFGAQQLDGRVGIWGELLHGRTLDQIIERDGSMSALEAIVCGEAICRALSAAHLCGVLHRDVKPQNVMRERGGRIVLMDFGLGIDVSEAASKPRLAGTPLYLAPELFAGKQPSVRSDIYSLGVLLFYLVTGSVPVVGRSLEEISEKHRSGTRQRVQDLRADLPASFVRVLDRALAVDPNERFESSGEFLAALAAATVGLERPAGPQTTRRAQAGLAVALVLVTATLTAIGTSLWSSDRGPVAATPVVAVIEPPADTRFTESTRNVAAVSPDGRHVVFVATQNGESRLWVRSLASAESRVIQDSIGASNPFWSPAGDAIAFFSRSGLRRVSIDGVRSETLARPTEERGGTWGSTGTLLFAAGPRDGLMSLPETGGTPALVLKPDPAKGEIGFFWPQFLDDGRRFVFFVWSNDERVRGIYQGRLGSPEYTRLFGSDTSATVAADVLLFVRDGTLVAQRFDGDAARAVGPAFAVLPEVAASPTFRSAVTASRTGTLVYTPFRAADLTSLVRFDRSGRQLDVIGSPAKFRNPVISADGRHLAVQQYRDSMSEIRWFDLERGGEGRLRHGATAEFPVWAGDGRLAFAATDHGWLDLFVTRIDRDEPAELLFQSDADKMPSAWSPDSRYLCFTALQPGGSYDLFALAVPGTAPPVAIATTTAEEADGQFSPDGRQIAYISTSTGRPEIYVKGFPFGSTLRRVSVSGGMSPVWGRDGALYYMDLSSRVMRVDVPAAETVAIPAPVMVMQANVITAGTSRAHYAVAPDGRLIVNTPTSGDRAPSVAVVSNWTALVQKR